MHKANAVLCLASSAKTVDRMCKTKMIKYAITRKLCHIAVCIYMCIYWWKRVATHPWVARHRSLLYQLCNWALPLRPKSVVRSHQLVEVWSPYLEERKIAGCNWCPNLNLKRFFFRYQMVSLRSIAVLHWKALLHKRLKSKLKMSTYSQGMRLNVINILYCNILGLSAQNV